MGKPSRLNAQIYEEATHWFVEFRTGDVDAGARRDFNSWLQTSPQHVRAYLEIAAIWNEGPALDALHTLDERTLLARIASEGNIVSLERPTSEQVRDHGPSEVSPKHYRRWLLPAAFAAMVLLVVGVIGGYVIESRRDTYVTAIGEQRSLTLADGSTVELNSRSRIRVRFKENERDIELLEGQALFRVAKDHARPFVVTSGNTRVRAVGTQFDVYRKRSGTVVTVIEGRVAVVLDTRGAVPGTVTRGPDTLSAGEQVTVTRAALEKAEHPNIASVTAWTQRQIVFESASLAEVAEEFNRYNLRQLVVDDTALNDDHISGVFSSADPAALIRFLQQRSNLHIVETEHEIRISAPMNVL